MGSSEGTKDDWEDREIKEEDSLMNTIRNIKASLLNWLPTYHQHILLNSDVQKTDVVLRQRTDTTYEWSDVGLAQRFGFINEYNSRSTKKLSGTHLVPEKHSFFVTSSRPGNFGDHIDFKTTIDNWFDENRYINMDCEEYIMNTKQRSGELICIPSVPSTTAHFWALPGSTP